jgi:hypothetical protein
MRSVAIVSSIALLCAGCNSSVLETLPNGTFPAPGSSDAAFSYYLPEGSLTFTATYGDKATPGLITITPDAAIKTRPKTSQLHFLVYHHDGLSSDTVHVSYDAAGLLTTVESTTADQSTAAIEGVNSNLQEVAALQKALTPALAKAAATPQQILDEPKKTPEQLCQAASISKTISFNFDSQKEENTTIISDTANDQKCILYVDIRLDPDQKKQFDGPEISDYRNGSSIAESKNAYSQENCNENALCFYGSTIFTLNASAKLVYTKLVGNDVVVEPLVGPKKISVTVRAPDPTKHMFVRFDREAFVTNATSISFANGLLTDFKSTDPSEVVGFLSLPKDLLTSVTLTVPLAK